MPVVFVHCVLMDESRELLDAIRGLQDEVARLRKRIDHLEEKSPALAADTADAMASADAGAPTPLEVAEAKAEEKIQRYLRREATPPSPQVNNVPEPEPAPAPQAAQPSPLSIDREPPIETQPPVSSESEKVEQQLRAQLGDPPVSDPSDLPPIPPEAILVEFREHTVVKRPHENIESRIASYWFLRIAVAAIAIGFIYYARRKMVGPIPKIAAGYLGSMALIVLGLWRERTYPIWAHPLIAAGLALSYLTTYAMGFIGPMRVIYSLPLELTLLSVNVLIVMIVAEWRKSETIAGVALILGYITTLRSHTENYALYSVAVLSIAAIVFIWRNRWYYASLGAVIATYASHLYTWLYLPGTGAVTTGEHFRYHAVFLTAYFIVFALGSLLTRSHATSEEAKVSRTRSFFDASDALLLATFTRLNSALYMAAMILLLRLTRVYWDQAWVFFFAYASITAALSMGYASLPNVRFFYRMVASVAVTFGVISYCSPAWLPVLVAVQAVALLYFADREQSRGWAALSALVLAYSGLYVAHRTFPAAPGMPAGIEPLRWWTVAGCAVIFLAYAELLNARLTFLRLDRRWAAHAVAAVGAVIYFLGVMRIEPHIAARLYELLLPVVLLPLIALAAKRETLLTFAQVGTFAATFVLIRLLLMRGDADNVPGGPLYAYVPLALAFALLAERLTDPANRDLFSRTSLLVLLLMQMCVGALLGKFYNPPGIMFGSALAAFATVGVAAVVRSRPLLFSVIVPAAVVALMFFLNYQRLMELPIGRNSLLACGLLFMIVAALVGSRRFAIGRDQRLDPGEPGFEVLLALGSSLLLAVWSVSEFPRSGFLFIALTAALFAGYAVILSRRLVIFIVMLLAMFCGLSFLMQIGRASGNLDASTALYGCLTSVIIVGVERIMNLEPRYASRSAREPLLNPDTISAVSACLSTGALIMLILSLHSHPEVKQLLFTVAMAAAGCAWIGLGFGFNSSVYRRAGFGVICVAIAKAFLYDVWRLPESYIAASFIGLGLFLLPISYIYTKNREKINRWL